MLTTCSRAPALVFFVVQDVTAELELLQPSLLLRVQMKGIWSDTYRSDVGSVTAEEMRNLVIMLNKVGMVAFGEYIGTSEHSFECLRKVRDTPILDTVNLLTSSLHHAETPAEVRGIASERQYWEWETADQSTATATLSVHQAHTDNAHTPQSQTHTHTNNSTKQQHTETQS